MGTQIEDSKKVWNSKLVKHDEALKNVDRKVDIHSSNIEELQESTEEFNSKIESLKTQNLYLEAYSRREN